MFSFIRLVSAISFLLVMLAVLTFGNEFRKAASKDLVDIVNKSNQSLAQGFIGVWRGSEEQLTAMDWYRKFRASGVPATQWKNYNGYDTMAEALDRLGRGVFRYYEDTPIVEVAIYHTDGTRIIGTNPSHVVLSREVNGVLGANPPRASKEDGLFMRALQGEVSHSLMENQPFVKPDGAGATGTLVRTIVPITDRDTRASSVLVDCVKSGKSELECSSNPGTPPRVEAVLEIRYDVSDQWSELDLFQHIGMYGVMGIFSLVVLLLLFVSGRAESIIAKQHEANLELAAQAASAQAENRDKSQFLANVSHELRTPLNAIIGFSEFIKSERSGKIGNEKYAEYIRDIHSSGVHLLSLINDILDYSKAEADKLELEISEVDVTKTVKNSMRLVSPRAESAQVQLMEEIPREHFIIHTDAKKLKQVLLNLLSNSVKFTPSGGSVTVTMWQNVVDGGLSIEVKDTGIGIAPKDISRAMAPFGQVDNTLSRKYEGTGLGLPLTRKFVEIMGGTFTIASEVGKGTIITVSLPRDPQGKISVAAGAAESSARQAQAEAPETGAMPVPPPASDPHSA